jgi:hypothetical protein
MTVVDLPTADRWLDLNELAHYLGCSKRALSYDIAKYRETSDPFPVEMIYGRLKAKVKDAEAWLERHDRKRRVKNWSRGWHGPSTARGTTTPGITRCPSTSTLPGVSSPHSASMTST